MESSKPKRQTKQVPEANSSNLVQIRGGDAVEVLTESETYANAVHIRIKELLRRYEETYFEIARALFEVAARKLYLSMTPSYSSFEKYTEEAVGIEFRKARYLVSIWWWFGIEQRAPPRLLQQAQEIGWCVHPDTLVTTLDGAKPIWSIERGDQVMDAAGQWTKVLNKMVVPFEDAFKVKAVKCGEIIASEGHEIGRAHV
jgi:hypothetical protein